jgi:hypothetical protein
MKTGTIRWLTLLLAIALVTPALSCASHRIDRAYGSFEPPDDRVRSIQESIVKEIDALPKNHRYAGYYQCGYHGWRMQLWVAPRAGYLCIFQYDFGPSPWQIIAGPIGDHGANLVLKNFVPFPESIQIDEKLDVIQWGSRRYLLPHDHLDAFCSDVLAKNEPTAHWPCRWLLRDADEPPSVEGSQPKLSGKSICEKN